jgi:hypothetical protein
MLGNDSEETELVAQARIAQILDTFTGKEIARLVEARTRYLKGDLNESCTEHKRLVFARWLYEHSKING